MRGIIITNGTTDKKEEKERAKAQRAGKRESLSLQPEDRGLFWVILGRSVAPEKSRGRAQKEAVWPPKAGELRGGEGRGACLRASSELRLGKAQWLWLLLLEKLASVAFANFRETHIRERETSPQRLWRLEPG